MAIDFNPAVVSGISSNEFILLMKALGFTPVPSRMSSYNWFRGRRAVSGEYQDSVTRILYSIAAAHADKKLPLPITCKRVDRLNSLKEAISPYINLCS